MFSATNLAGNVSFQMRKCLPLLMDGTSPLDLGYGIHLLVLLSLNVTSHDGFIEFVK